MKNTTEMKNNRKNLIKKISDNKGFSLLAVMVTIGFVAILGTLMLYLVSVSYRIRIADVKNKVSFYSAEHALEEVKAGIEEEISDAMGEAYVTVMQNYAIYTADERVNKFEDIYINKLRNKYRMGTDDSKYNLALFTSYLVDTAWSATDGVGAILSTDVAPGNVEGTMLIQAEGVTFKNLTVEYRSPAGSYTKITTDIKVQVPDVDFSEEFNIPDIASFCLIANDEIAITSASELGGNMYAGKDGITIGTSVLVSDTDLLVTDGNLDINNVSSSTITFGEDSTLWVNSINVANSKAAFKGTTYLQDDLAISGTGSEVKLANSFYAYGNGALTSVSTGDATKQYLWTVSGNDYVDTDVNAKLSEQNSSIIINGMETKLDMADVTKLYLAGTAFIKSSGATKDGFTIATNDNKNIITGESIAAKGEQIAYLVPAECLLVSNGKSTVNVNPITEDLYKAFDLTVPGNKEVDLSVATNKMRDAVINYVSGYQKVFSNKNNNKLIYYYLTFATEDNASKFFKVYYENNKDKMDRYIKAYIKELDLPTNGVDGMMRVNLAGNIFSIDATGAVELISATAASDDLALLRNESFGYAKTYRQLKTTLTQVEPTDAQNRIKEGIEPGYEIKGIFYNIINKEAFNKVMDVAKVPAVKYLLDGATSYTENSAATSVKRLYVTDSGIGAVIVDNADDVTGATTVPYNLAKDNYVAWDKANLVVATGDVVVDESYNGIVISGGKISTSGSINVISDEAKASSAMQLTVSINDGGTPLDYMLVNLFTGGNYAVNNSASAGGEAVKTDKLIVYKNWKKE